MALQDFLLSVDFLLDYVMEQWMNGDRPAEIVMAMCVTHWPGRQFEIADTDMDNLGFCYLEHVRDIKTGENAYELLWEEIRKKEFPRYVGDPPPLCQLKEEKAAAEQSPPK